MNSQAISSMSFVVNAAYTFTFANSMYFMLAKDPTIAMSLNNIECSASKTLCGTMAMVMTMRFFFGNNQYIESIISDNYRTAWIKFYHFIVVALQSLVLLFLSYAIPNSVVFLLGLSLLFYIEVAWYFTTYFIDPGGVLPGNPIERWSFFWSEMSNLAFASVAAIAVLSCYVLSTEFIYACLIVFAAFIPNTTYDAVRNMPVYMGEKNMV